MIVRYFKIALAWFFISITSMECYGADNLTMIRCLMKQDKKETLECIKKEFPAFYCEGCSYEGMNVTGKWRDEIEKARVLWVEEFIKEWSVLYNQCSTDLSAESCVATIDIVPCKDLGGRDEDEVVGGLGKGYCYGLAAFLKKDKSICENQFDYGVKVNCNSLLESLTKDCPSCNEWLNGQNGGKYFMTSYAEGKATMGDVSDCDKINK